MTSYEVRLEGRRGRREVRPGRLVQGSGNTALDWDPREKEGNGHKGDWPEENEERKRIEKKAGLRGSAGPGRGRTRDTVQVVQPTQTAREPRRIYTE